MISKLGLGNFLSFSNQPPISLGKLNVFVGRNSSGKSTILHALALLSETVSDPSRYTSFLFSGNGLNLGTYRDVVHKNNRNSAISFDLTFKGHKHRDANRYRLSFREDKKSLRPYVSAVSAYKTDIRLFTLQGHASHTTPGYHPAEVKQFKARPSGIIPAIDHFLPIFRLESELRSVTQAKKFGHFFRVNRATWEARNELSQLVYLGPSRSALDAVYFPFGRYPTKLDSTGSNSVPFILGNVRRVRERRKFERTLNRWLGDEFGLAKRSVLKELAGGQGVRLQGVDPLLQATVTLSNTGYGVSQILPILIQLAVGKPCTLLIEQPEIHLHPEAQSLLANLLFEFVARGYQLLVETHSEHVIYRLRALVARGEGGLTNEDVRLFHVEKEKTGSRVHRVDISKTGELSGWPAGFFSASAGDIVDLLKAATK